MTEPFVHPQGICETDAVGPGTRIWAFAHVLPGARIGAECNICDGVFVENDVVLGDRVTVKCGVQIWDGISIEDDVFIGPNVTFTNDPFPRSKVYPSKFSRTIVRQGASIGANATILPGIEIGVGAMVGAGAVVTRSVPPNAIVVGNPARIKGYVTSDDQVDAAHVAGSSGELQLSPLQVGGASLHNLKIAKDMRGELSVGEFESDIPFAPKRYFLVYNVPSREVRGEHAHKECEQFLICVRGSCGVLLDDGEKRIEVTLDRPDLGLYMPAMIWGTQYHYSPDAVLLVFASHGYDPNDYIRSYNEFIAAVRE
ncbi:WxcM-like domain-containing protein [Microvirga yunnanensis]|uniref:WxcM-like domain-containing protein n=1 Tax=Microvirga yunnanensis TaxID=2953740 RepID=UPI0021C9B117|nr:WxcM-like domain-containing protein [Microvirga sp. HBU65207]